LFAAIVCGDRRPGAQFAVLDEQRSQFFNGCEELLADLLFQYFSQQSTERTHITTQRRFFQIASLTDQLSQSSGLVICCPEWFSVRHPFYLVTSS
jgi:hypothetical protein